MKAKQLKCIDFMVLNASATKEEIAKACKISRQTLYTWLKDDEFIAALDKKFDEAWKELSKKAQHKMEVLIASDNEQVSLGACKYVLDSNGRNAVQKNDVSVSIKWED